MYRLVTVTVCMLHAHIAHKVCSERVQLPHPSCRSIHTSFRQADDHGSGHNSEHKPSRPWYAAGWPKGSSTSGGKVKADPQQRSTTEVKEVGCLVYLRCKGLHAQQGQPAAGHSVLTVVNSVVRPGLDVLGKGHGNPLSDSLSGPRRHRLS